MLIAILEDVFRQANMIARSLLKCNHDTIIFSNGNDFIDYISTNKVDFMILDWDVPGKNGIEVLQWARSNLPGHMPILMMTHHDGEEDIIHALDKGADDYLIKPVNERQLIARVNAQIRKLNFILDFENNASVSNKEIIVGKYSLDVLARTVCINSENSFDKKLIIHLSEREIQLTKLLFNNIGRIINKDHFIRNIWKCAPDRKYDPSLSTYISKIRKLLSLNQENNLIISTIYNYGYRLEYC